MKIVLILLLTIYTTVACAQPAIPVGSLDSSDTNEVRGSFQVKKELKLLNIKDLDSSYVLATDVNGRVYLKEAKEPLDTTFLDIRYVLNTDSGVVFVTPSELATAISNIPVVDTTSLRNDINTNTSNISGLQSTYVKKGGNDLSILTIGTTENYPFTFITNNLERIRVHANGNVTIGSTVDVGKKIAVYGNIRIYGEGDYYVDVGNSIQIYRASNGRRIYQLAAGGDYSARLDMFDGNNSLFAQFSNSGSYHARPIAFGKSGPGLYGVTIGDNKTGWSTTTGRMQIYAGAAPLNNEIMMGLGGEYYTKVLYYINSGSLNYPSTAANSYSDLTITVTGAEVGDCVSVGVPAASVVNNGMYSGWVSATNTVTVRFLNNNTSSIDPAAGTFNIKVFK